MGKLIGTVLIFGGCMGLLAREMGLARQRIAQLHVLQEFFVHTAFELRNHGTDMGIYLQQIAQDVEETSGLSQKRALNVLQATCQKSVQYLEAYAFPSGACAWEKACMDCKENWRLNDREKRILQAFGEAAFGRFGEENVRKLEQLAQETSQCLTEAQKQLRQKQKVLAPATMLGGALLCILLV